MMPPGARRQSWVRDLDRGFCYHFWMTPDKQAPVLAAIYQAELLHASQQKAGTKSTFGKSTGGGHGICGTKVEERVKTFLDKHLLGKDVEVSSEAIEAAPMAAPAKKADGKKPVEKK